MRMWDYEWGWGEGGGWSHGVRLWFSSIFLLFMFFYVFLPPFLSLFLSSVVFSSSYFLFSCSFILFLNFYPFFFIILLHTFLFFSWYFFLQRYRPISEGRPISHLGSLSNSSLLYNLISVAIWFFFHLFLFMETVIWTNWFFCAVFPPEFSILKRTWEQELLSFIFSLFLNALFILYFFKTASFISLYKSALFIFLLFSLFCPIFAFDLIFFFGKSRGKNHFLKTLCFVLFRFLFLRRKISRAFRDLPTTNPQRVEEKK